MEGKIEYVGLETLFDEDQFKVQDFATNAMEKIIKLSDYKLLKLTFKSIGNNTGTHKKKFEIIANLSRGQRVVQASIESKENGQWNPVKSLQELLKNLVEKVKVEKERS